MTHATGFALIVLLNVYTYRIPVRAIHTQLAEEA